MRDKFEFTHEFTMEVIRVSTEHHFLSSRDQTQNQAKT